MKAPWGCSGALFSMCVWLIGCISWSMAFWGDVVVGVIFLVVALAMAHLREPIFYRHPPE